MDIKKKIVTEKVCDGEYMVYIKGTGTCVDIQRIHEYSAIGKAPVRYRVDFQGVTKHSCLPLAEAKSNAIKILRAL